MSRLQDWVKIFSDPVIASGAQGEEEMGNFVQLAIPTDPDGGRLSSATPTARRILRAHKKLFRSLGSLDGLRFLNLQENLS